MGRYFLTFVVVLFVHFLIAFPRFGMLLPGDAMGSLRVPHDTTRFVVLIGGPVHDCAAADRQWQVSSTSALRRGAPMTCEQRDAYGYDRIRGNPMKLGGPNAPGLSDRLLVFFVLHDHPDATSPKCCCTAKAFQP